MTPGLFLDRDGVINVNYGYVCDIARFEFIPGIFELVRQANQAGFVVVVVTNQSGIAREYFTETEFLELSDWMCKKFSDHGAMVNRVYYCPHHPNEGLPTYRIRCQCRKPGPGMFFQAIDDFSIDPRNSVMIGDKDLDMRAARVAGIARRILFDSSNTQNGLDATEILTTSSLADIQLNAGG